MEEEKQCILVIVGATDKGQKELIAIAAAIAKVSISKFCSTRGLEMGPQLALGDGALGFWKALRQLPRRPRATLLGQDGQRLEQAAQGSAKESQGAPARHLDGETRKDAESAFDFFRYGPSTQGRGLPGRGPRRPADVLRLPRRALEACTHDQPHREHVRHGSSAHLPDQGCLSRKTAMAMVFKLCQCAQRKWRKLDGSNHLAEIIRGVKFVDGERQDPPPHDQPIHNF